MQPGQHRFMRVVGRPAPSVSVASPADQLPKSGTSDPHGADQETATAMRPKAAAADVVPIGSIERSDGVAAPPYLGGRALVLAVITGHEGVDRAP